MTGQKPRQIAAAVLRQRRTKPDYVENLLERALAEARLAPADRGLCQELVYGVVRWQVTLDWLIARKTPGRTQKPALQDLLRLGLYQIFWLDRIPAHAAVHETVEQARHGGFGPQAGFVNAVLRGYLREADATRTLLADLKQSQPALGWSHPEWLVNRWQSRWGAEATRQLLAWNNTPPKTFARINTLKTTAETLLPRWRSENVEYDFFARDWTGENLVFELKSFPSLPSLATFRDGHFYIQDPSTLLAVRELAPQLGEAILDLCAAPGGKTTFLAQCVRNEARIVAADASPERLKLVEENCTRLGVTCVKTVAAGTLPAVEPGVPPGGNRAADAQAAIRSKHPSPPSQPSPAPEAAASPFVIRHSSFDKILVDAPCSNTGVLRRRVDLRWRIHPEEIARLRATQLDLLRQAASLLKPGGRLVYSTCSLQPEENHDLVQQFLTGSTGFTLESERELLPFVDEVDGAYVARLRHAKV